MIRACILPADALLQRSAVRAGCYTDCFETALPQKVALPAFLDAFYGSWLFGLEKLVLRAHLRGKPVNWDIAPVAAGTAEAYAAWTVEGRGDGQILMCDLGGHTRSYLAVDEIAGGGTRLLFGSAVVPRDGHDLPWLVRATVPLHRFYARSLLRAARARLV